MRKTDVTCDGCGDDLTARTNCVDYRLCLSSESKPGSGEGFYTSMALYPAIDRDYHFCDLKCLDLWRDRERYFQTLWFQKRADWRKAHGVLSGGCFTYPGMPEELRAQYDEQFMAEALAKFPMTPKKRSKYANHR